MTEDRFLYISTRDVEALRLDPALARSAVIDAFRAARLGEAASPPKQILDLGKGRSFMALPSVWR